MNEKLEKKITGLLFHVRLDNQLSDSILNYFSMSVALFFYGCRYAELTFAKNTESLIYEIIFICGIVQIILAIYDWYKGKSLTLFTNILFGLLFISWYYKYQRILKKEPNYKDKQYEGIIYILLFALALVLIISVKNKSIMYSINYLVLAVSFAFVIVDKYAHKDWSKKTFGYCFIVLGGLFWITGLLRFINAQFLNRTFSLVKE